MEEAIKNIEIGFRRLLIRILSRLVRRRAVIAATTDFNSCKFLFVRQDRIGDVLISTPLFQALKNHYPGAILDVLLSVNNHFALDNDPLIRKRWIYKKNVISAIRMIRAIRREKYDFVIDLMDNPSATSTVICLLSGSQCNIGLDKENAYVYDVTVPLLSRKHVHIVDRIAQLLRPFRIDPANESLHVRYTVGGPARQFAADVLNRLALRPGKIVGINISAGHEVRFWGIDNFRSLISQLRHKTPRRPILLLFKPQHESLAKDIVHGFEDVYLSPLTHSFDEFAALISVLGLLITPDTSAVHLAAAFDIPSVVLYVQSDKSLRIWDPYKSPSVSLVADIDDLRVIPPGDVVRAASKLANHRRGTSRRRPPIAMSK